MKPTPRLKMSLAVLAAMAAALPVPAQTFWIGTNGVSASTNWSDTANWSTASTPAGSDVVFTNNGVVAVGTVNNVVDSSLSLASLTFANNGTNTSHTALIAPGVTLDISGASGPNGAVLSGGFTNADIPALTNRIIGVGGTLNLNNVTANLIVRQGLNGAAVANRMTLDMSGLDTFNANVGRVLLSGNSPSTQNRATGRLMLARTNVIVASGTAPALIVGESTSNNGGGSTLLLGQTNALFVNNIAIGRTKEVGSAIRFNTAFASPYVLIRGTDGTSAVASWTLGDGVADTGTTTCNGTADFTLGTVDALIGTLQVGRGSSGGTGGNQSVGTFSFGNGVVEVATLQLGMQSGSNFKGGSGTMNVNGGVLNVTAAFEMGRSAGSVGYTNIVSRLNINGGTVRTPFILATYGANPSTNNNITMNNGVLFVTNSAGPGITTFNITNSVLHIPATLAGATIIVTNHAQGGTTNVINVTDVPGVTGYPTSLPLIKYSGALSGTFNVGLGSLPPSTPPLTGFISNNIANSSVDLVITGGPVPLRSISWNGGVNGDWDIATTANWKTNVGPGTIYNDGDFVTFDDSASGAADISLTTVLAPSSITVSNNSKTYGLGGSGSLTGPAGLVKQGSGTLFITNNANNDFAGPITIAAGTLRVGDGGGSGSIGGGNITDNGSLVLDRGDSISVSNTIAGTGSLTKSGAGTVTLVGANSYSGVTLVTAGTLSTLNNSALGTTNGGTTVSSGATLDVNARNLGAEPVSVSGTGSGGGGAIVNSGAQQLNALRFVTMLGDTTVGGSGRWDIRATTTSDPSLAGLSTGGNAYKLTKVGANQVSLVGVTVDAQLDDVDVQGGIFSVETATTSLGNPNKALTVASGASLQLFQLTNQLNKVISLTSDGIAASIINNSGANTIIGPITMVNDCNFNVGGTSLTLSSLSGAQLTKNGGGNLILAGSANNAGTFVNVGKMTLNGLNSAGITNGGLSFLAGSGTNNGFTHVTGALFPGDTNVVGTITLTGLYLDNGGTVFMDLGSTNLVGGSANDLIQVNGDLTVNANTITINPQGLLLKGAGFPYRLMNYTGGLIWNGDLTVAGPQNYVFAVNTNTPGQINVVVSGGPPIWNGGSAVSGLWSDAANWNGTSVQPNDALYFAGTTRLNSTNDTSALTTYSDLVFDTSAGAFKLTGNPVTLANTVVNNSVNTELVQLNLVSSGNNTFSGNNGTLIIGGGYSNTAAAVTTLTLGGTGLFTNILDVAAGGTNQVTLNASNANWTLLDNSSSAPMTAAAILSLVSGTFNFGAGSSAPNLTSTTVNGGPVDHQFATVSGAITTFNMVNGTLTTSARINTATAVNSTGIVNQVGGTLNIGSQFQGANGANAGEQSYLNVSGGILNIGSAATPTSPLYVASRGNGVLTISGSGIVNSGVLDVARNAAGNTIACNGLVNLNGGTLTVSRVGTATANSQTGVTLSPTATINFNGGVLKSRAASTTFVQGSTVAPIIPITAIVKSGGAIIDDGSFAISVVEPLIHDSGLGGSPDGGLVKFGTGTLTLGSINTYTGPTIVSNGTLAVNGSLTAASAVTVRSGGILTGTGTVGGSAAVNAGGAIAPGTIGTIGTLNISGAVSLQGTTVMEVSKAGGTKDLLNAGSITYGGTLTVTNLAGTLAVGDSFKVFTSSSTYAGLFSSVTPAGVGLRWNTSALGTTGTITVTAVPKPTITAIASVGGSVVVSGGNGLPNNPVWVLSSTNCAAPIASWQVIATGNFDGSGSFSYTNAAPSEPRRFYLLQAP